MIALSDWSRRLSPPQKRKKAEMSGKGSRARRVEATRRAYADVYRLRGAEMSSAPFGNERQDRIYAEQYAKYRRSYWHMERMLAELTDVYGYTPLMTARVQRRM